MCRYLSNFSRLIAIALPLALASISVNGLRAQDRDPSPHGPTTDQPYAVSEPAAPDSIQLLGEVMRRAPSLDSLGESREQLLKIFSDPLPSIGAKRYVARMWQTWLARIASTICNQTATASPLVAYRTNFDNSELPTVAVDANDWTTWMTADRPEGHENCSPWAFRIHEFGKEVRTLLELLPPEPVWSGGLCGSGSFQTPIRPVWDAWNLAWDNFETFHRARTWVTPRPLIQFNYETGEYIADRTSQLRAHVSATGSVTLNWHEQKLATADIPELQECEGDDDSSDHCGWKILAIYYSPRSMLFHLGHQYSSFYRPVAISSPDSPEPLVYCAPGAQPIFGATAHLFKSLGPATEDGLEPMLTTIPPLDGPRQAHTFPAVDAILASESAPPERVRQSQPELHKHLLRDPLYPKLASALRAALPQRPTGRSAHINAWISYFESPKSYAKELEEERRWAKQAELDERKRKASERSLLTAVPSNGARCRSAIKQWHEFNKQIERAAISGNPELASRATENRNRASQQICQAANHIRNAIRIYQEQGLQRAASAVEAEYAFCLRSCN